MSDAANALIDSSYVWSNGWSGIVIEVSPTAIVRNNMIMGQRTRLRIPHARDHGRRHLLSASSNIQVYNNNIWYNQNGIVGIEQIEEVAVNVPCRC